MQNGRAVVSYNVVSMRADTNPKSEQVSQALFGETVELLDVTETATKIKTPDGYEGWSKSDKLIIQETGEKYPAPDRAVQVTTLLQPIYTRATVRSERVTLLTIGTTVEVAEIDEKSRYTKINLPDRTAAYVESNALIVPQYPSVEHIGPNLTLIARAFIGIPYLWGGRSTFGIDCSGFVQRIYWLCGHIIPRDAYVQAASPLFEDVSLDQLKSGDLIFFKGDSDPRGRGITHVGMAQGDGRFIHASGDLGVSITPLDDKPYIQQIVCARRLRS